MKGFLNVYAAGPSAALSTPIFPGQLARSAIEHNNRAQMQREAVRPLLYGTDVASEGLLQTSWLLSDATKLGGVPHCGQWKGVAKVREHIGAE